MKRVIVVVFAVFLVFLLSFKLVFIEENKESTVNFLDEGGVVFSSEVTNEDSHVVRVDIPNEDGTFRTLEGEEAQAWYNQLTNKNKELLAEEKKLVVESGFNVSNGTATGSAFSTDFSLTSRNGKIVYFWVENNGDVEVKASINEKVSIYLKPGEMGHIHAKVGYFTSNYKFKIAPTPNGGEIDIKYDIVQNGI